jgi:hypothetical protein
MTDRLADAQVLEHLALVVERQHDLTVGGAFDDREPLVILELRQAFRRLDGADDVDVAGQQRVVGRGGVVEVAQDDFGEVRQVTPVVGVVDQLDAVAADEVVDQVRTGANGRVGQVVDAVRGEHRTDPLGHVEQPTVARLGQGDPGVVGVDRFHRLDAVHRGRQADRPLLLNALDAEDHRVGVEVGPVREGDPLAEEEVVDRAVVADLVGLGEQRHDLAVLVEFHQPFVDVDEQRLGDGRPVRGGEVEVGGLGREPDDDRRVAGLSLLPRRLIARFLVLGRRWVDDRRFIGGVARRTRTHEQHPSGQSGQQPHDRHRATSLACLSGTTPSDSGLAD